jgi:hypothetical protein
MAPIRGTKAPNASALLIDQHRRLGIIGRRPKVGDQGPNLVRVADITGE